MEATSGFSKAFWGMFTDYKQTLEKLFAAPMGL
jgi:hypothetical protein